MIFYLLSGFSIIFALATVSTRQILRSAVYLMGVLSISAGLYLLLDAEFLAGIQILVYVGGIVILLVFGIMLTQTDGLGGPGGDLPTLSRKIVGAAVALTFFATGLLVLLSSPVLNKMSVAIVNPDSFFVSALGRAFLSTGNSGYLVPFEVISLLLLAVLIAGIVLARKEKA